MYNKQFFVDESNEEAYKIIKSIIDGEIETLQLVIQGFSGSGKTHIVDFLKSECNQKKVFIINTLILMGEYIQCIKRNELDLFWDLVCNNDILVVEDIYFISGKYVFQEELLNIIIHYKNQNKIIIFTSEHSIDQTDFSKKLYNVLKEFEIICIKELGFCGKIEYIQDFIKQKNAKFTAEEINEIITYSKSYRDLNGNLNRLFFKKQNEVISKNEK